MTAPHAPVWGAGVKWPEIVILNQFWIEGLAIRRNQSLSIEHTCALVYPLRGEAEYVRETVPLETRTRPA